MNSSQYAYLRLTPTTLYRTFLIIRLTPTTAGNYNLAMCLFNEKEFKEAKKLNGLVAGGIICIILAIVLPFIFNPGTELLPQFTSAQVAISAIGFIAVLSTLCLALIQLRKSMAKPRIKVAFSEKGDQQVTFVYKDGILTSGILALWLINEGTAIARCFQIDFIIPENIGKQSQYASVTRDDGEYIFSYTNDGKYTLFVNKPYLDPNIELSAALDTSKCMIAKGDNFEMKYRIYGDWAETQEGKLKVNIKKLQGDSSA